MKFSSAFLLVNVVAFTDAGVPDVPLPKVSVGLNIGEETVGNALGGLEPTVKWQTSGTVAGLDLEGGFSADVTSTKEVPSPSYWGKIKKSFTDIAEFSIRGDVDSSSKDTVALDVRASVFGTDAQLQGSLGKSTLRSLKRFLDTKVLIHSFFLHSQKCMMHLLNNVQTLEPRRLLFALFNFPKR